MKKSLPLLLSCLALGTALILVFRDFQYTGIFVLTAALSLVLGYYFGKWTCHLHTKKNGFLITVTVFILLNFLHSLIDGASVGSSTTIPKLVAILSHELARQPALYIILWGMLTPFTMRKYQRLFLIPLIVTGTWCTGLYIGQGLLHQVSIVPWLEPVVNQTVFLFIGDIIHHIVEESRKLQKSNMCCHT